MKALIKTTVVLAATVGVFFACSKDDKKSDGADAQTSVELAGANVTAQSLYDDVLQEVMQVNLESGLTTNSTNQTSACRVITIDPMTTGVFPKTVTIDYGTGCTNLGITRKGKIVYTITNKFLIPGATISASFEGYSINDYKLEGVLSATNSSSGLTISLTTSTTAGKLTYPDGKWYTYTGTRTWIMTAGIATPTDLSDDEYTVTGNGTLASSAGNTLVATIKTGLLRKFACANVVSGVIEGTFNNIPGTLDFGSGSCDKNATLTVFNKVYEVTLP